LKVSCIAEIKLLIVEILRQLNTVYLCLIAGQVIVITPHWLTSLAIRGKSESHRAHNRSTRCLGPMQVLETDPCIN
jgi:hypothetical protein